jgi:hypothetical protein
VLGIAFRHRSANEIARFFLCCVAIGSPLTAGRNGDKIHTLELTGDDPSVRVSRTRESACSQ